MVQTPSVLANRTVCCQVQHLWVLSASRFVATDCSWLLSLWQRGQTRPRCAEEEHYYAGRLPEVGAASKTRMISYRPVNCG